MKLGGSFAWLAVGLLVFGLAAAPAGADTLAYPTDCFVRTFGEAGRTNDTVNSSPADGPETGNYLYRIDQFDFTTSLLPEGCSEGAEVFGLSIVVKNPFDIPGPNDLDGTTFSALSSQMETDFPEFSHWTGWSLPPPTTFSLNESGFHGVSVCVWTGSDVGNPDNLSNCLDGTADRFPLIDVDGQGMVFSLAAPGGESAYFCGECDDPLEIAVIAYSDVYGDTIGVYSHPEAVIGYSFVPLVPEPSLLALLGTGLAALAWRRRASA